ncbi:hypothetical protein H8A97_36435 [Bradyrhizobium sp. Arg62]|uniref:hypothetical protein n=1 Tax=Bradyrhizobium brasilense TaxID=1419277 RepID=UPI001E5B3734|nr:hypothetical protein [Bradyrhizobium brasilense]MCC8950416.1 hypothetical protein [Bradyrhizobium brasilense]
MNQQTKPQTAADALEHPFGTPGEHNGYRIFPDQLANDAHVYFHGTEFRVLQAILEEGFRIPPLPLAPSVSFSPTSNLALSYACSKRSAASPEGVVIVVRFQPDNRSRVRRDPSILYVDHFDPQPEIVGYCIVPADYVFR